MTDSTYVLSSFTDLYSEIKIPLNQTQRVKYTCIDASTNYIVIGASSGSIYIFQRSPCKYLQLIQNMYGPINHVAISPQEKFIAFSTIKGTICIYVIKLSAAYPQIVTSHYDDTTVLCLHWKRNEERLFYGDDKGNVFLVHLTSFLGRNLTNISIHPILFLEAPIVQIADYNNMLLVSNYDKCILCNIETEEFKPIGNKPRNGRYGACFLSNNSKQSSETTILCARPGTRLWVVNLDGNVMQTSQFKMALSCPPTPIFNKYTQTPMPSLNFEPIAKSTAAAVAASSSVQDNNINERLPQNLQLSKLQPLFGRYIFAYTKDGFYIFDPSKSSVLLWNDEFRDIQDIKLVNKNSLVIFTTNGRVFTLKIETLEDLFSHMLDDKLYNNCVQLLLNHCEYFQQKFTDTPIYVICLHKLRSALCALEHDCDELREKLETNFGDFLSLNDIETDSDLQLTSPSTTNVIILGGGGNNMDKLTSATSTITTIPSQIKEKFTTKTLLDDNLKSIIISTFSEKFTKNIFNKFNFFNDESEDDVLPSATTNDQSVNNLPITLRKSLIDLNINDDDDDNCCNDNDIIINDDDQLLRDNQQINRLLQQPIVDPLSCVTEKNSEDRLLQNLFMIYKSSQMSNMTLIDRYGYIFDQYDCAGIAQLLEKLEFLCIENGERADQAKRHCIEMYFNYLCPDIVWEFDDESRNFIINGFITVNTLTIDNNNANEMSEKCTQCAFPILMIQKTIAGNSFKYPELARTLFKYLWSRNQQKQCMDIVMAVPQTLKIICQYAIQDELNVEKLILLLYACDDRQLFDDAIRKYSTNNRLWMKTFDVLISLQNAQRIVCWNCGANNSIQHLYAKLFDQQNTLDTSLRSWSYILDLLLKNIDGTLALQLIMQYANFINCDVIDRDFYLRCLLKP